MDPSSFVGLWTINDWSPNIDAVPEGIPSGAFQVPGLLVISRNSEEIPEAFSLHWLTQDGDFSTASSLHNNQEALIPTLIRENFVVSFGTTTRECDMVLSLDDQGLNGFIGLAGTIAAKGPERAGPDAGSGTFTATANAGPSGF
jgi:hypothetical protein